MLLISPGYNTVTYTAPAAPLTAPVEIVETLDSPASIERYIGKEAVKYGLDPVKAQSIAWAESRFKIEAKNPGSTASGVWQFLNGTFSEYCITKYKLTSNLVNKNDVKIQTECALRILKAGGEDHWNESRPAWAKYQPTDPQLSLK